LTALGRSEVATEDDTLSRESASPERYVGSLSAAGRFARWWAGWRIAIRIARRDARRYKWRSALIAAMVGLPVLLLTGGITLLATNDISMAESVPRVMGSAQARIHDSGTDLQVAQSPDSRYMNTNGGVDTLAVPGFASGSDWTTSKVQKLTGGRVIPTIDSWMRVTIGDRRPTMPVLGIDARDPLARGMTDLVSGRWANSLSEVVVTKAGIANGLPNEGTLTTVGADGRARQLTVVGVAAGQTEQGVPFLVALPVLVTAVADQSRVSAAFLVGRDPVTWPDVRRLNDYGLLVQSRQVFGNPPPAPLTGPRRLQRRRGAPTPAIRPRAGRGAGRRVGGRRRGRRPAPDAGRAHLVAGRPRGFRHRAFRGLLAPRGRGVYLRGRRVRGRRPAPGQGHRPP
jgi:putative ABC transport system permease protein